MNTNMNTNTPLCEVTQASRPAEQTMLVDGCKVTLRFSEKPNPTVFNEIRKILFTACTTDKPEQIFAR